MIWVIRLLRAVLAVAFRHSIGRLFRPKHPAEQQLKREADAISDRDAMQGSVSRMPGDDVREQLRERFTKRN